MWRAQVEALNAAGRTALAVDLPGHGSRRDEPFSVRACLDTAVRAIDDVGGRALLVGLSLGGYIAIAHAGERPDQVAGLVAAACSTTPGGPLTWAWRQSVRVIDRLPDRGDGLNRAMVRAAIPAQGAADLAAGGFALEVMGPMLEAMSAVRPLRDLARVTCPVWLVNGQWDHFRRQERAYLRAASSARTARLVVIPGASHLVSVVRPVAFTRVLLAALDDLETPDGSGAGEGAGLLSPQVERGA
ncbi:MAG: alpha/beta hydrolase [Cellulomonadaceae bacterium]|nr:alpha/beta hydrolase [Cellulomonadaceae bacterium]